jgi:lysozyme family protein
VNKIIKECIQKVYGEHDYDFFRDRCKNRNNYLDKTIEEVKGIYKEIRIYDMIDDPSIEVWFGYNDFSKADLQVEYKTLLRISKVANIFVVQHEFSVKNIDPERMSATLDGFGGEPYTFMQSNLENLITKSLTNQDIRKISLSELDEVIPYIEMPTKSLFGEQMTVDNALFRDLCGICEN